MARAGSGPGCFGRDPHYRRLDCCATPFVRIYFYDGFLDSRDSYEEFLRAQREYQAIDALVKTDGNERASARTNGGP